MARASAVFGDRADRVSASEWPWGRQGLSAQRRSTRGWLAKQRSQGDPGAGSAPADAARGAARLCAGYRLLSGLSINFSE